MYSLFWSLPLGAVLVDQYCNPLADVTLSSISAQLDEIAEKVKKMLRIKNSSHPSLRVSQGEFSKPAKLQKKSYIVGFSCFVIIPFILAPTFVWGFFSLPESISPTYLKPEGMGFNSQHSLNKNQCQYIWANVSTA